MIRYRKKIFILKRITCITVILFFCIESSFAQEKKLSFWEPATELNKKRLHAVSYTTAGLYAVTMTGLYQLWYKDYPLTHFHFFNDNSEWMQMDKCGHMFTSYIVGNAGVEVLQWTGMPHKKATWIGGSVGFVFLSSIEVFDGFSKQWGFSWGDMTANALGAATCIAQELIWNEQRIELKYSYHLTSFAQYRPDVLGSTFSERLVKDYNGHTYWLSGNIASFLSAESRFPKWLNISVGYGAEGMTGGYQNISSYKGQPVPSFDRYRQFYFAPDLNLTKIKTNSKFLKFFFNATRFIKFPLPALEYNSKQKWVFHGVYF